MNWAKGIDENGRPISNNLIPDEKGVTVCPSYGGGDQLVLAQLRPRRPTCSTSARWRRAAFIQAKTEPFEEGRAYYSTGARRPMGNSAQYRVPQRVRPEQAGLCVARSADWRRTCVGGCDVDSGRAGSLRQRRQGVRDRRRADRKAALGVQPGRGHACSPMSYGIEGKQYFAVAAGDNVVRLCVAVGNVPVEKRGNRIAYFFR